MLAKILDLIPAIAFFVTYQLTKDLVMATAVIIACSVVSFTTQYILWRKTSRMQIFVSIAILLFGLPTIFLNDPAFIKWKPTVVCVILAITIFVCQFIVKRNPFAYLFGKEIPLPEFIWFKLGTTFMCYFVFSGLLNMVIAFYLPAIFGIDEKTAESWWVNYKTFGSIILNCTFALVAFYIIGRRHPEMFEALKATAASQMGKNSKNNVNEPRQD